MTVVKDKIVIWLSAELLRFGIAKSFQSQFDCELYAIVDITDKPKKNFQRQKFVNFTKTWYYHDYIKQTNNDPDIEYLQAFEKKYGINLWLLAFNERIFYQFNNYYKFTAKEVLLILEQECKLFESILDEVKPNFVLMPQSTFHHYQLFLELCRARGICCLLLKPTRFGNKAMITNENEPIYHPNSSIQNHRSFEGLQDYFEKYNIFRQSTSYRKRFQSSKKELIKAALNFLFVSKNTNVTTHYTYFGRTKLKVLFRSVLESIITKYRKWFIDKNLIRTIPQNELFIFFPLHIEEEHSLLIVSPFYINQLEIIKSIVKSLPIGYKLYVKEHPSMFARNWRKVSFYKEIMNLPEVRLIHPSVKPSDVLKKCSLVIVISGTTALDAAFYRKPSIVLADTSFSRLPFIHRLKSLEDLPSTIRTSLQTEVKASDLDSYVNYIEDNSFNFDYNEAVQDYQDHFHFGGFLVDVEISEEKMDSYLKKYEAVFDKLALEHIKKINQYKNQK